MYGPQPQKTRMKDKKSHYQQEVALFRYGVISPLLPLAPRSKEFAETLRMQVNQSHRIPGSSRTRVARQTIYDWIRQYRSGGFEALKPKRRSDRGKPRRIPVEVIETLLSIRQAQPHLSVKDVILQTCATGGVCAEVKLPLSTVHRLLRREQLTEVAAPVDRRRFAYQKAGQLWMSDVMHGPRVKVQNNRRRKTYLIAFIDDATRVIPYAAFAFSESIASFLKVMKQALLRRGIPQRLYVDNGANFRSRQLAVVCARLNIALIHARPYMPAGKGKIERWFRTCRSRFVNHLEAPGKLSLEQLNERLWNWIEGEYHRTSHRGLPAHRTPLDQWARRADKVRWAQDAHYDFDELFLFETKRRVMKDRTVRLNNRIYEVDAALIGHSVTLRYDPEAPARQPLKVEHHNKPAGLATLLDAYANTRIKRSTSGAIRFRDFD